jgi:hypothetical protein
VGCDKGLNLTVTISDEALSTYSFLVVSEQEAEELTLYCTVSFTKSLSR